MDFDTIARMLEGVPHIVPDRARVLYDFILREKPREVLELGFAHGVSTCYMAAALDELGVGQITTIDIPDALKRSPDLYGLLERTGLSRYVSPIIDPTSYTWTLMEMIEAASGAGRCQTRFDFIFIDGAHSWEIDGFALFLSEKLLRPGGWILFDDLYWSYDEQHGVHDAVGSIPARDRTTPQIDRVFHLLATQHPSLDEFHTQGNWGWARKRSDTVPADRSDAVERLYREQGTAIDVRSIVHKLRKRVTLRDHSTLSRRRRRTAPAR